MRKPVNCGQCSVTITAQNYTASGQRQTCDDCVRVNKRFNARKYYAANREKATEYHQKWQSKNREHLRAYHAQWRANNPDRWRELNRAANKEFMSKRKWP